MADEFITVSTYTTVLEAEMARSVLDSAGIESFIHAPHANWLYPGVLGEVKLQVRKEDLDTARDLLDKEDLQESD
ncbi:hypothetical protein EP232_04455 [bacterium]|nr:MAG: hypothetical protein EP232_04455 [bacterium]